MKPTLLFTLLLTTAASAQGDPPAPPAEVAAEVAAKDDTKAATADSKAADDDAKEAREAAQAAKELAAQTAVLADKAAAAVAAAEAAAVKAPPEKATAALEAVEEANAAKAAAADEAADAAQKAASAEASAKQAADEAAAAKLAADQAVSDEAAATATLAVEPTTPGSTKPNAANKPKGPREKPAPADATPEPAATVPAQAPDEPDASATKVDAVPAPAGPDVVDRPGRQNRPKLDAAPAPNGPEVVDRSGRSNNPQRPDGKILERQRPTRVEELEPAVPLDAVELRARERQGREERLRLRLEPVDPVIVRRQFFIEPRIIEIPVLPPQRRAPDFIEVQDEVFIRRVYDPQRNVVVVVEEKQARELPYVAVPVLFVRGSAELLDAESRRSIEQMAGVIREVIDKDPRARFDIEGHASTDGAADFNMTLSVERARRIYDELTLRYRLPDAVLTAHGYGENYPAFPDGTEDQRMLDRRVLIVRTQ